MLRRFALLAFVALLLAAGCTRQDAPSSGPDERWNVILISIDTLRADRLGAYGGARELSPRLDAFAAEGVVFEDAIAQAPWTLPSHASLLASEHPSVLDVGAVARPRPVHESARLLAEVLRDEGYRTYGVAGGGYFSGTFGFDQGFERLEDRQARDDAGRMFGLANAWLDGLGEHGPFFLLLHTFEVHAYDPPEEILRELWAEGAPASKLAGRKNLAKYLQTARNHTAIASFTADDWRCAVDRYDGAIRSVDRAFGEFLDGLAERGLLEKTLIVVTSDHGEEQGEHGRAGHGYNLHDENTHVPLLFVGPVLPARRVDAQVRLLDVAPTIVDLLGVEAPSEWKGASLVPVIAGEQEARPAFSESAHVDLKALRADGFKYVLSLWDRREHLYDLAQDPGELIDVADERPEELARLRGMMADYIRETAADERFRGLADVDLSAEKQQELQELGYTGDANSTGATARAWLDLMKELAGE